MVLGVLGDALCDTCRTTVEQLECPRQLEYSLICEFIAVLVTVRRWWSNQGSRSVTVPVTIVPFHIVNAESLYAHVEQVKCSWYNMKNSRCCLSHSNIARSGLA